MKINIYFPKFQYLSDSSQFPYNNYFTQLFEVFKVCRKYGITFGKKNPDYV